MRQFLSRRVTTASTVVWLGQLCAAAAASVVYTAAASAAPGMSSLDTDLLKPPHDAIRLRRLSR